MSKGSESSFRDDIAKEVGISAAAVLGKIHYWVKSNAGQDINIINGVAWWYHSLRHLQEDMDYLSFKQVRTSIDILIEKGWITARALNAHLNDQTMWYTLTQKAVDFYDDIKYGNIDRNGKASRKKLCPGGHGGCALEGKSPIKTNTKEIANTPPNPQGEAQGDLFEMEDDAQKKKEDMESKCLALYEAYPYHDAKPKALAAIEKALEREDYLHLMESTLAYAEATATWAAEDKRYIPLPATWFNGERYNGDRSRWIRGEPQKPVVTDPNDHDYKDANGNYWFWNASGEWEFGINPFACNGDSF